MSEPAKYETIARSLREALASGGYAADAPFLTDAEACQRFQASRVTVRHAFRLLEREGLIYRLRGRGTRVHPSPGRQIRLVAFIGACLVRSGIEPMIIKGAEEQLARGGSNLIICNTENSPERALQHARRLIETQIEGVIMTPLLADEIHNLRLLELFAARKIPVVLVGRTVPTWAGRIASVLPDNRQGGAEVAEHLLGLGHRRIAFFHGIDFAQCSALKARYEGFVERLAKLGQPFDPALRALADHAALPLVIQRWQSLAAPPTAVFVDNDVTLPRFVEAALGQGLSIPRDLSVVGFDDLPSIPCPLPHTSVHVDHDEIGRLAAAQLVEQLLHPELPPRAIHTPVTLTIRKTSGIAPRLLETPAPRR